MENTHKDARGLLEAERERLENEINTLRRGVDAEAFGEDEGTDTVSQHPADDASEMFEREKNLTVINTLEVSLTEVNDALERVEANTYGICANCGKPIGEKRLAAVPAAKYCIDCQTILERQSHF